MPALIALVHMAAEGGRAAVANRLERLPLMGTQHRSPSLEEVALVCAKDIGHFEPMVAHRSGEVDLAARTRSSGPSNSNGLLVERIAVSAKCR